MDCPIQKNPFFVGMRLRIHSTNKHYFSIVFVSCRDHFQDIYGKFKTFGNADEINNVECIYTDYHKVREIHKDKETMEMDFNSDINDVYKVMDSVQINWVEVINDWLNSNILISDEFEEHCPIKKGKEVRKLLLNLIQY